MSEAKFTKGGWKVHSVGSQFAVGPLSSSDDQSHGMMNVVAWIEKFDVYDEKQSELNAHLIAVAPEMYELIKDLTEMNSYELAGFMENSDYAIELLAKARGEHV